MLFLHPITKSSLKSNRAYLEKSLILVPAPDYISYPSQVNVINCLSYDLDIVFELFIL
jgi:hypothetical protein